MLESSNLVFLIPLITFSFMIMTNEPMIFMCLMFLFMLMISWCFEFYTLMEMWIIGFLMIVTITGLFLIFAYIVGVIPMNPSSKPKFIYYNKIVILSMMIVTMTFFLLMSDPISEMMTSMNKEFWISSDNMNMIDDDFNMFIGISLVTILLMMIISFVQMIHSKGGSLRKKF